MSMKTTMIALAALAMSGTAVEAAVSVSNVVCTQQYPWNGKVDIDYEVFADDPAADVWVYATGFDKDANVSMGVRAISGDGANAPVKPGKHRMTWDVTSDYPGFNTTKFTVKMTALTGGAPYMVVDLSGGVDAISYPVSYLSSVPAGGWTDEYKTTKLVLRLIPPGTFMMGSPSDELGRFNSSSSYVGLETQHQVTLTKPFYIGVFELTQRQWVSVMGSNPIDAYTSYGYYKKGDLLPAHMITYDDIRGTVNGASWPAHNQVDANSFMGRLRSKVNMLFDLPTEAQWEYACRAGTATALNNGKNLTATGNKQCRNLDEVANYNSPSSSSIKAVGCFLQNFWGLYDMHGNVNEWCLDWLQTDLGKTAVVDPKGSKDKPYYAYRVLRGGCFYAYNSEDWSRPQGCRSATRKGYSPSSQYCGGYYSGLFGFRVVCLPAE